MSNLTSPPDADTTYERLPTEPMKAWNAFVLYRDLGSDRTLEAVRKSLSRPSGYLRQLQEWSRKWDWVKRSRLFDQEIERASRKASEKSIPFWQSQREQALLNNLRTAKRMRERLDQMLEHPVTMEVRDDYRGVIEIHPASWSYASLATMVKTLADLEAQTIAEGLSGAADESFDVETATIEELRAFIQRTRRSGVAGKPS